MKQENKRLTVPLSPLFDSFVSLLISRRDPLVNRFLEGVSAAMPQRVLDPRVLPCTALLAAAQAAASSATRPLLAQFARDAADLHWGQTYSATDLDAAFLQNYGWVELFGTRGHFENESVAGGFLVLGPHTNYPDHHHQAEELYLPLTSGSLWRLNNGPYVERGAGELIHHSSNANHAMQTRDQPLVALYLWRGGPLAAQSTLRAVQPNR